MFKIEFNNLIVLTLLACLSILSACKTGQSTDTANIERITLTQLKTDGEKYGNILRAGKPLIIKIPAGATIPIQLNLEVGFASFVPGDNNLRFDKATMLLISQKGLLLSPDGKDWAPIQDIKGLKKIFNIKGGSLALQFSARAKDGPFIRVNLQTKN